MSAFPKVGKNDANCGNKVGILNCKQGGLWRRIEERGESGCAEYGTFVIPLTRKEVVSLDTKQSKVFCRNLVSLLR